MKPIVDGLQDEYGDQFNLVRVDIDTDRGVDLAREHGFIGQPTFIFFGRNGEEVRRLQGGQTRETLEMELQRIIAE